MYDRNKSACLKVLIAVDTVRHGFSYWSSRVFGRWVPGCVVDFWHILRLSATKWTMSCRFLLRIWVSCHFIQGLHPSWDSLDIAILVSRNSHSDEDFHDTQSWLSQKLMKWLLLKQVLLATWVQQACCLSYYALSPFDRGRAQHKLHTYSYILGHCHSTECHKMVAQRDRTVAEAFPRPYASLLVSILQDY